MVAGCRVPLQRCRHRCRLHQADLCPPCAEQMQIFGWRIPFFCASLTSGLGYFMRRGLPEPAAVAELRARHLNTAHYQGRAQAQEEEEEEEEEPPERQHDAEGSRGSRGCKSLGDRPSTELDQSDLEMDPVHSEYLAGVERGRRIFGPKAVPLVSGGEATGLASGLLGIRLGLGLAAALWNQRVVAQGLAVGSNHRALLLLRRRRLPRPAGAHGAGQPSGLCAARRLHRLGGGCLLCHSLLGGGQAGGPGDEQHAAPGRHGGRQHWRWLLQCAGLVA